MMGTGSKTRPDTARSFEMKPNFALTLSFEGISLLRRAFPGWANLGEVSLDSADLMGDLASLRAKAPDDAQVKLVLPNDQIKFITLPAPDGDPEEAARNALTGATPYEVGDLSYDFAVSDGQMQIAAVARETLAEAEAFAGEHGFTPICFVAIPEDGTFTGEPFFGPTAHARSRLTAGESIERDSAPIRIISAPATPKAADTPKPVPAPIPKPAVNEAATDKAAETAPATPEPAPAPKAEPTPESEQPEPVSAPPEDMPEEKSAATASGFATIRAARADTPDGSAPKLSGASRLTTLDGTEIPKAAPSVTPPDADTNAGAKSGAHVTDDGLDIPPVPAPRMEPALDAPAIAAAAASLIPDPETRLATPEADIAPPPPKTGSFFSRRRPKEQPDAEVATTQAQKDALRSRRDREKERMTVFGARGHEVGGKPKFLGLILTAVLLLFLVGVAAWASVFLDDGLARLFGGPKDIKVSEVSAGDETPEEAAQTEIIPLPSGTGEELAALTPDAQDVTPLPAVTPLPERPEALSPSEALARYAATGIWQVAPQPPTGDGPAIGTTEVYEAAIDPGLRLSEASRPVSPPNREMPLATQLDPPPAGVLFEFDSRGFIRAVQDGIVSPEGVRLVAGRPALLPPEGFFDRLPAAPEPEATMTEAALTPADEPALDVAEAEAAQTPTPEDGAETNFAADPALAGLRPRARPEGLAPEDGAAAETDAQTETATLSEADAALAALRPRVRPAEITAAAESAVETPPEQNASAATLRSDGGAATPLIDTEALNRALTDAAQAAAPIDPSLFENPTPQAVTASLTPNTRPSDFASTVERAQEQTAATPVRVAQVLTPSLPSRASVARQATQKNAINLRKINLIGVYGSPNSRRALVRLGNGRYKKVQVGDRLDGGQVAAIGDSELRYVKRGRNLTLQMPQG